MRSRSAGQSAPTAKVYNAERLGMFVVLSENHGDGPRLFDRETGEDAMLGLAERLGVKS
jgi:hypothetical protein